MTLQRVVCPLCRLNSFTFMSIRFQTQDSVKPKIKKEPKTKINTIGSPDVIEYMKAPKYDDIRRHLPNTLFKKFRAPETMYVIDQDTARHLVGVVGDRVHRDDVLIEVNPGIGILTQELLRAYDNDIHLFEMSPQYVSFLKTLHEENPHRIKYTIADFFGMWKLAFRDNMDGGTRMQDLLGDLANENNKRNMKVLGAMPTLNFIKHLIYNILFHNTSNVLRRPDLYIAMPSYNLAILRDEATILRKNMFRALPALFELLFDHEVLDKMERKHFLPWQFTISKAALVDQDIIYLVKITQKKKLPCKQECLPLLWYFMRSQFVNKSLRVIPSLEQWVPGAGVWLITGQDPPDTNRELGPDDDDAPLPHMTIFTQYGDLSTQQKLTVFKRFISWPEFESCPFKVNMENNLPRSIAGLDKDGSLSHGNVQPEDMGDPELDEDKHGQLSPETPQNTEKLLE